MMDLSAVAKILFEKKYKKKQKGNFFLIIDKSGKFYLHKKLYEKLNQKKLSIQSIFDIVKNYEEFVILQ